MRWRSYESVDTLPHMRTADLGDQLSLLILPLTSPVKWPCLILDAEGPCTFLYLLVPFPTPGVQSMFRACTEHVQSMFRAGSMVVALSVRCEHLRTCLLTVTVSSCLPAESVESPSSNMVLVVVVRSAGWNETDMRDFARVDMLIKTGR
jgi:hypothetical protein